MILGMIKFLRARRKRREDLRRLGFVRAVEQAGFFSDRDATSLTSSARPDTVDRPRTVEEFT